MDPAIVNALSKGPAVTDPTLDADFEWSSVGGARVQDAILSLQNNPEVVTKKVFPKTYTLVLVGPILYFRTPRTASTNPLTRGEQVQGPEFAPEKYWYKVTSNDPNAIPDAKWAIGKGRVLTKPFESNPYTIEQINNELYWARPKPQDELALEALEGTFTGDVLTPDTQFKNEAYDWLTYETVVNKPKFRKTNQSRPVGLYLAKLSDMQIWVRQAIPPASFTALCDAFFPDLEEKTVQELSDRTWWWKKIPSDLEALSKEQAPYWKKAGEDALGKPPAEDFVALIPESRGNLTGEPATGLKLAGSRSTLQIHLPVRIVMPYNYNDNDVKSKALGTTQNPASLWQLPVDFPKCWSYWRTASRSCVMKLQRVKDALLPWQLTPWKEWPFKEAESAREALKYDADKLSKRSVYVNPAYCAEVKKTEHFHLPTYGKDDPVFSVKTGVAMVGFERQTKADKEVIGTGDEWIVGAIRSDYIMSIEALAKSHGAEIGKDVVVQTEILSILERKKRSGVDGVDGASVRDLSVLDRSKVYIPALSIPFIDLDGKSLTAEFAHVENKKWCDFWQQNWAEALGRAKGYFLVRYGLQHANPNVQNYLIEFPASGTGAPISPSKVIIRDVADALLSREVAWALFGDPSTEPPAGLTDLGVMRLPVLKYNFRSEAQSSSNETGTTDKKFGPPGAQFLWQRFTVFYTPGKLDTLGECPEARRPQVLALLAKWGIAHNAAYIRTVEEALGYAFETIAWDRLPNPERYVTSKTPDKATSPYGLDLDWEEESAGEIQKFLRSEDGRKRICAHHNQGWKNPEPAFRIRLEDGTPQPLKVVFCSRPGKDAAIVTRLTDANGEIPFFKEGGDFKDYEFSIAAGEPRERRQPPDTRPRSVADKQVLKLVRTEGNVRILAPDAITALGKVTAIAPPNEISAAKDKVSGTATADPGRTISSIRFLVDGKEVGTADHEPFEAVVDSTGFKNGDHTLVAEATDSAGSITASAGVKIKVNNPVPTVQITESVSGELKVASPFKAQADPGAGMTLKSIQFQRMQVGVTQDYGASGASPLTLDVKPTELKNGKWTITAVATDTAGNSTTSAPVEVTIANDPPKVAMITPAMDYSGKINLTADATPGAGLDLEFVKFEISYSNEGGTWREHGGEVAGKPYSVELDVSTLPEGRREIRAVAKDKAGNSTNSAPIIINVVH